jgi:hypothetical protein
MTDKKTFIIEWCSCDKEPYLVSQRENELIIGCPKCGKTRIVSLSLELQEVTLKFDRKKGSD